MIPHLEIQADFPPIMTDANLTESIAEADLESGAKYRNVNEIDHAKDELGQVRETLDKLRLWHDWGVRRSQYLHSNIKSKIFPNRPPCPPFEELKRLATFFFPPRAKLIATVCDYGEGRFERHESNLALLWPGQFEALTSFRSSTKQRQPRSRHGRLSAGCEWYAWILA